MEEDGQATKGKALYYESVHLHAPLLAQACLEGIYSYILLWELVLEEC